MVPVEVLGALSTQTTAVAYPPFVPPLRQVRLLTGRWHALCGSGALGRRAPSVDWLNSSTCVQCTTRGTQIAPPVRRAGISFIFGGVRTSPCADLKLGCLNCVDFRAVMSRQTYAFQPVPPRQWSSFNFSAACHSGPVPAGLQCALHFSRSVDGAVAHPLLQRGTLARLARTRS